MKPPTGLSGFRASERVRNLVTMGCFGALSLVVGAIQFRIPGVTGGISDLRDGAGTRFDPHIVEVFLDRVAGGDGVAPS